MKTSPRTISGIQYRLIIAIIMLALLAICMTTAVHASNDLGNDPSTAQIFKKAQDTYASLTSYSDEGKYVSITKKSGTTIVDSHTKLARPNLYRVDWTYTTCTDPSQAHPPQVLWSTGDGIFYKRGEEIQNFTEDAQKELKALSEMQQRTLSEEEQKQKTAAVGLSGNQISEAISGSFFNLRYDGRHLFPGTFSPGMLGYPKSWHKKQTDEKVGEIDCYVFFEAEGATTTLWIGKQDFLIHQIRCEESAADMKSSLEDAARVTGIRALAQTETWDINWTKTYTNIVLNQKFSPSDFAPSNQPGPNTKETSPK